MSQHPLTALVPIADGTEEIEFATIADVLMRGGISVTVAGTKKLCRLSRGIRVEADCLLSEISLQTTWGIVAVPGGMGGAETLGKDSHMLEILNRQKNRGGWLAAICAAPALVLKPAGVLQGEKAVGYPTKRFNDLLADSLDESCENGVLVSGKVITGTGPGTAFAFSLKIVEMLAGKSKAVEIGQALLCGPEGRGMGR